MQIRLARPDEFDSLGEITVEAYQHVRSTELGAYAKELADVAGRAVDCAVLVAVADSGELLGGVTYVPGSDTAMSEFSDPQAAGIRMLAVRPVAQGAGVGRALTEACIAKARDDGRERVLLHSTPPMTTARRMYEKLGFVRCIELDEFFAGPPYSEEEPLHLMAYTLTL